MQKQWDVIVVGAGPAGMSTAMQCAEAGLEVLVLDRQNQAGGQIWKNAASASSEKVQFLGKEYAYGVKIIQQFLHAKLTFISKAQVWYVDGTTLCASIQGESHYLMAKTLVLATGAMERPAPVVGWDLPCVMGVGACDLLLKSSGITPKAPIVICGNGPLILPILAHLCHLKVPIAGLILTGNMHKNAWNAFLNSPKILARPLYFINGMSYFLQTILKKIPKFFNAQHVAITEDDVAKISFISGGKTHSLQAQTVLLHEGIISESLITRLADCRHVWDAKNRYWHAEANAWGETNVNGVYIAGDVAGVSGAEAALAKGHIVGIDICAKLGKYKQSERDAKAKKHQRTLMRCRWMQDFTDALFTPNPAALIPADDTIVCRCEEITAKEIKDIVLNGGYSLDFVKAQCRSGMGLCQGCMCSSIVANIIAEVHGIPLESLNPYKARPPLFPVEIDELARFSMPNIGQ